MLKKIMTTALAITTPYCLFASNMRFTHIPTPYNMSAKTADMNLRTSSLDANDPDKLIATAQPSILALQKVNSVLSTLPAALNKQTLNIVDLRREPHIFIHIIDSTEISLRTEDNAQVMAPYTLKTGWYAISATEGSHPIADCQNNYEALRNTLLPIAERGYNTLDISDFFKGFTVSQPVTARYDQVISEKEFFEKVVPDNTNNFYGRIHYRHYCVEDYHAFSAQDTLAIQSEILADQYNGNLTWVHCWGGNGRSSQYIGLHYLQTYQPDSPEVLLQQVKLFNNNHDLFEKDAQKNYLIAQLTKQ